MKLHLTLRELEVFCAIVHCGNVQKAAESVGLTQSAASQALSKLEQTLGQSLFDRIGRQLVLNAHGRTLFARAHLLLQQAQELEGIFSRHALSLKVGASTTIANYLMPLHLSNFRHTYPDTHLALTVGNTEAVVAAVANAIVDIGFIEGGCHHPELRVFPWRDDDLVVFISSRHPKANAQLSRQQLASLPWLLREAGSGTREEVERMLLPYLGHFNLDMELGDSEAIKHAVAVGLGVSCLSRYVIQDMLESRQLVKVNAELPPLKRQLYCVMHKAKVFSSGLQAFLQCGPNHFTMADSAGPS